MYEDGAGFDDGTAFDGEHDPQQMSPARETVSYHDANADGIVDTMAVDVDGDGADDYLEADDDGDGMIDRMEADLDGDGSFETGALDTDRDGRFDVWVDDADLDGRSDTVSQDLDGDGAADRFVIDADGDGMLETTLPATTETDPTVQELFEQSPSAPYEQPSPQEQVTTPSSPDGAAPDMTWMYEKLADPATPESEKRLYEEFIETYRRMGEIWLQ